MNTDTKALHNIHASYAELANGDHVKVLWPNGHGYDVFRVWAGVAIPRFDFVGRYEYQHDGSAIGAQFGPLHNPVSWDDEEEK